MGTNDAEEESEKLRKITMNVLTMQLNSITIMDLIAASLQIRKHKSKATETEKRKACRKRWLLPVSYTHLTLPTN